MLLAFDTATPLVTVALHDGSDVVVELVAERPMKHAEQLAPLIDRAMASSARTSPRSRPASARARSPGCGSAW